MKKSISILLLMAVLLTMAVPAAAFSDITDQTTQKEVAVLQMMGVINGTSDNTFSPGGTLTRAQFCKMAVIMMGRGEEEPLYRNRTIFPDVRSSHWARGYINLAVTIPVGADEDGNGGIKLIRGMGDGTFRPDRNITYAEAVTILIRMLGYSDKDAGMSWPNGFLELAGKIGLTVGMSLSANQSLTRAQAAHLFSTMLTTPQKSGGAYYNALGTVTNDVVLMNGNATADDGTAGAMGTSEGTFKAASGVIPAELVGSRGTLVTDKDGKAVAFIPVGEQKTITVGTAKSDEDNVQASWITDQAGNKYMIPPTVPAYTTTEKKTYGEIWMDIRGGSQVTLYYSAAGKVEGVYVSTAAAATAMVARSVGSGNPFASLLDGAASYTIYRDGSPASVSDICLYDVGTYDPATHVLSVSSTKLTGRYDNVWPNLQSPAKVTIMGKELNVMDMAIEDMSEFKLGQTVTVLLTADGQVAGAVDSSKARGDNIGVVQELKDGKATVSLLNGITVSGECSSTNVKDGELARVSSNGVGKIVLSLVTGSEVRGNFNVADRKIGSLELSGACHLYEKLGRSAMQQITLEDLTVSSIHNDKILYAHENTSGKIDILILSDVTGDLYTYGMLKQGKPQEGSFAGETYYNQTVILTNAENKDGMQFLSGMVVPKNKMGGIVVTADGSSAESWVTLTEEKGVKRSDFQTREGHTYVTLDTQEMMVAENVQCYNKTTQTWFASLADARAFSDNLTVYYDRPVDEGGKVRIVVAE